MAEDSHMQRAIDLAREAAEAGDEPFGALLVRDGEVIAEARNTVNTDDDVTAHPELKLARWAARELPPGGRDGVTMYASTEPCAMCSGALYHAGLRRVVYSVSAERADDLIGLDLPVPSPVVFERGGDGVEVLGPVLAEAGERVHRECWALLD